MGISKINVDSKIDNSFEEQHHHLLSCLEHATVSLDQKTTSLSLFISWLKLTFKNF
jgi:hypothetical protein